MPDEEQAESPTPDGSEPDEDAAESPAEAEAPATQTEPSGGRTFSRYGIASVVLALLSVAAIAVGVVTWSAHHHEKNDRAYQNRVLRAAANWNSALVNLNAANVDAGMARLRGKTVGKLHVEFDSAMQPYRAVIQKIKSRSTGRVESVTIQPVYHDLGIPPGAESAPPPLGPPPSEAARSDTVMVVATTVVENPGAKSEIVRWNLLEVVSDVGGTLFISGLRSLR